MTFIYYISNDMVANFTKHVQEIQILFNILQFKSNNIRLCSWLTERFLNILIIVLSGISCENVADLPSICIGQVSQDWKSITQIFDANFEKENQWFCHSYSYLKIAESNV